MELLPKAYEATAAVLVAVRDWSAPSPCSEWTVGQVRDHLVEAHHAFAAAIDGGPLVGLDFAGVTDRCLTAFGRPGALAAEHPFPFGPTTGAEIARISLSETVVHGWDIAVGAGVPYAPPEEAVAVLLAGAGDAPEGMFGPPVPVPSSAPPLVRLLAHLGRKA